MKISMEKDFCGVLNNGPLMISVGGWANETTSLPFEHMKKVTNNNYQYKIDSKEANKLLDENHGKTETDFFLLPDHVTAYINEVSDNKEPIRNNQHSFR